MDVLSKKRLVILNILCAVAGFVLASFGELVNLFLYGWTSRDIPFWVYGLVAVGVIEVVFFAAIIFIKIRRSKTEGK